MSLEVQGANVGGVNVEQPAQSFGAALKQSWANTFGKSFFLGALRVLANLTGVGAVVDLAVSGIAHWRGTLGRNAQPEQPARVGTGALANLEEAPRGVRPEVEEARAQTTQVDPQPVRTEPLVAPAPFPKISSELELFDFVLGSERRGSAGRTVEDGSVMRTAPGTGVQKECKLYSYEGLVFRGDSRPPETIIEASGGFKSKNDLTRPENMLEAQGLGQGIGATGQSGVSCAKKLDGAFPYCTTGQVGYVYIVDTTKLGQGNKAYDMADISMKNGFKATDETGGEVNVTDIPPSAIIGWLEIPTAGDILDAGGDVTGRMLDGLKLEQVHMNPLYGVEITD